MRSKNRPKPTAFKPKNLYPDCPVWTGESLSKKKCSRHVMFQHHLWKRLQHKAQRENKSVSIIIEELLLQSLFEGGKP